MFGRQRRAERRAQAEADRLFPIVDEPDRQTGRRPNHQREITAGWAARIRAQLGVGLVREASTQDAAAAGGVPEHWAISADDVERIAAQSADARARAIDRLGEQYPEPDPDPGLPAGAIDAISEPPPATDWIALLDGVLPGTRDRYLASQPGSPEHKAAYVDMHREAGGEGFAHSDPDRSYLMDHGYETASDRFWMLDPEPATEAEAYDAWVEALYVQGVAEDRQWLAEGGETAQQLAGENLDDAIDKAARVFPEPCWDAPMPEIYPGELEAPGPEPGDDAMRLAPGAAAESLGAELQEHAERAEALRRAEARALAREHIAQSEHDSGVAEDAREQAQDARSARLAAEAEAYDTAAALQAAVLEDETPADEQPEASADRDAADHLHGSPERAEADPETAHLGAGPGEPQDGEQPPVQPATPFSAYRQEMCPEMLEGLRDAARHLRWHPSADPRPEPAPEIGW